MQSLHTCYLRPLPGPRSAVFRVNLLLEEAGVPLPSPTGPKLTVNVAEKGAQWCRLRIHGTPAHASRPLRTGGLARSICQGMNREAPGPSQAPGTKVIFAPPAGRR